VKFCALFRSRERGRTTIPDMPDIRYSKGDDTFGREKEEM